MEDAVLNGDARKLAELLRQDPSFKVNMVVCGDGRTLLHFACLKSSRSAVIPFLLAHPDIDVNVKSNLGHIPFDLACVNGFTPCVREMLKDSRVKVNEPDKIGSPPLWQAANGGHLDVVKWWIACGREMDLGKPGEYATDAIGMAMRRGTTEMVTLLGRFQNDATKTRHAMRVELGWYDDQAAKMLALVVFVSDGLLQIKDTTPSSASASASASSSSASTLCSSVVTLCC